MSYKLVDTHCHLDDEVYKDDLVSVIEQSSKELDFMINIGCCIDSSKKSRDLAEKNRSIYFSAGVHPNYSDRFDDKSVDELTEILQSNKAVAVGEIGLDHYRRIIPYEIQDRVFRRQLELAKDFGLPSVIHSRESYEEIYKILSEPWFEDNVVVMHSYAGIFRYVEKLLNRAYVSFSGMVTFKKNSGIVLDTLSRVPLDRILIETDSPYLTPEPNRGKRNVPSNVRYIAKKVAEVKGLSIEKVAEITTRNAREVFNIKR